MSYKTITLSLAVYERLKKLKQPGESFSDMLWRELPEPLETCGEIEAHFDKRGVPRADPKLRKAMLEGRGRRNHRK